MSLKALMIIFFQTLLYSYHSDSTLITENHENSIMETPWMVIISRNPFKMIEDQNFVSKCPGVLIYRQAVLASAKCIKRYFYASSLRVDVLQQRRNVSRVVFSNDILSNTSTNNDLAFLILSEPVLISMNNETIQFPEEDEEINTDNCKSIRYYDNSQNLQSSTVNVSFVTSGLCKTYLSKENEYYWGQNNSYWEPNVLCSYLLSIENCIKLEWEAPVVCSRSNYLNHEQYIIVALQSLRLVNSHSQCLIQFLDITYMSAWIKRELAILTWNIFYTTISKRT